MTLSSRASPRPKSGMGAKFAGGNPDAARGRDPDEFYPTPPAVTRALFRHYHQHLEGATVWEPCAGDGAMADELLLCGAKRVVCSDTKPRSVSEVRWPGGCSPYRIIKGDVLATKAMPAVDAIITNPPFDIAAGIIHHILTLPGGPPPFLALVLKATYWHSSRRGDLFDRFPPTAVHPLRWRPDFKNLGAPTMDIMWSVWDVRERDSVTTYEPFDHPGA